MDVASEGVDIYSAIVDVASEGVDIASEGVDVYSAIVDVASEGVDVASEGVDLASTIVDVASKGVDVASEGVDLNSEGVDLKFCDRNFNNQIQRKNLVLLPGESALGNLIHYACLTLPNAFHVFFPITPSTTNWRLC